MQASIIKFLFEHLEIHAVLKICEHYYFIPISSLCPHTYGFRITKIPWNHKHTVVVLQVQTVKISFKLVTDGQRVFRVIVTKFLLVDIHECNAVHFALSGIGEERV